MAHTHKPCWISKAYAYAHAHVPLYPHARKHERTRTNAHMPRQQCLANVPQCYAILTLSVLYLQLYLKVKVKLALEQAMKAQRGNTGTVLLFL